MTEHSNGYHKRTSHQHVDSLDSDFSSSSTLQTHQDDGPTRISLDNLAASHRLPSPSISATTRSPLLIAEDQKPITASASAAPESAPRKTATWSELPHKSQLALLTISRLAEPLTQTSLQSYMFYQLKSFDPSQSDDAISSQAGLLAAAFTAAQFVTAIPWGRAADSELFGRKSVILIGLLGTMISALGFGFSRSFYTAVFWRVLGGALNGNVGVMRTMITEIILEKRFQSRAFMLLPMTFNVGVIVGPILGGLLSDPVSQYPGLFGEGSVMGGTEGVWWMKHWPYALPNIASAMFLFVSAAMLFLGLDETHEMLRGRRDVGRTIGRSLMKLVVWKGDGTSYSAVPTSDDSETSIMADVELQSQKSVKTPMKKRQKLPISRIWTKNVIITLCAHGSLAFHVGTFNALWFIFLSTPRWDPKNPQPPSLIHPSFPIHFNGGLALTPAHIGFALSILGVIGIFLQLVVYPSWSGRYGVVRSYRYSLFLFPICYTLTPYLSLLPSTTAPPGEATGPLLWLGITLILSIQVMARTFALPGTTILVNNSCPHPNVLSTYHGIAQSISSAVRTVGPASMSWLYGRGLVWGVVGTGFWGMSVAAVVNNCVGAFVRDGDGHEIKLPGEEGDGDEEGVELLREEDDDGRRGRRRSRE